MSDDPRQRILTALTLVELEAKVAMLLLEGWERSGEVALAKSVVENEPPYLSQVLIKGRTPTESADVQ